MTIDARRVAAVLLKEIREYRRSPFIVGTMVVLPLIFLIEPTIVVFRLAPGVPASTVARSVGSAFLLLLITPVLLPAVLAAHSVVGEREQGTLEPLLTTPIRRGELLLGKALAVVVPAVAIAYGLFAIVEITARLFASNAEVAPALSAGPHLLAEALFAPLLAGWSIWAGLGISTRASDVRVAQQLGTLASLPPLIVVALVSFDVVTPSFRNALIFAVVLLAADVAMGRVVSAMFDRERLITGVKPPASRRRGAVGALRRPRR